MLIASLAAETMRREFVEVRVEHDEVQLRQLAREKEDWPCSDPSQHAGCWFSLWFDFLLLAKAL